MEKKEFIEWLAKKEIDLWAKNNKMLLQDIVDLVDSCVLFEMKYGIPVGLKIEKMQEYANRKFKEDK